MLFVQGMTLMILMNSKLRVNIYTTCNEIKLGPCQSVPAWCFIVADILVPFQEACGNVYVQMQATRKFRQIRRTYTNFVFQLEYLNSIYVVAVTLVLLFKRQNGTNIGRRWYKHEKNNN